MNQMEQFMFQNTLQQKENTCPELKKLRKIIHVTHREVIEMVPTLIDQGYRPVDPFSNWSPRKEDVAQNLKYFEEEIQSAMQQGKYSRQIKIETYLNLLFSDQVDLKQLKPVVRYWEQKFTVMKKHYIGDQIFADRLQKQMRGTYRKSKQV